MVLEKTSRVDLVSIFTNNLILALYEQSDSAVMRIIIILQARGAHGGSCLMGISTDG